MVSFLPVVGSSVSKTVSGIGEFFKTKELISAARKLKGLAADPVQFS